MKIDMKNVKETMNNLKQMIIDNKKKIIIISSIVFAVIIVIIGIVITLNVIAVNKSKEFHLADLEPKIDELGYKNILLSKLNTKIEVANLFGISEKDIDTYIVKPAGEKNKASMYMIIKPTKKSFNLVKEKIDSYFLTYDELWKKYLPEQYKIVKNKTYGIKDGYIYVFVSDKSVELEDLAKKELRK